VIVEWIWAKLCEFFGWLLSQFPTFTLPDWWDGTVAYMAQGVELINGVHNWLPLTAIRNCLIFLLAVSAAVFAVRAFRIVLSLFTGGGGGAA
jgi:hypothetical protein